MKIRHFIKIFVLVLFSLSSLSCRNGIRQGLDSEKILSELRNITADVLGKIGVAVIYDNTDTLVFNNSSDYPLMSMFKLHEAIAVCHILDSLSLGLDFSLPLRRQDMDLETWSPMLKEHPEDSFSLTVGELLRYILVDSDNNASNILFDSILSVGKTDRYIRSLLKEDDFEIVCKESEMRAEHNRSYCNRSSPLSYASLVNKLFTEQIVSDDKQNFIKQSMADCATGLDRIAAGLPEDAAFAHRTGSGYVNSRGEIIAVNDGGYVSLPSCKSYSIAVFVKDFAGSQEDAEHFIARISKLMYAAVEQ